MKNLKEIAFGILNDSRLTDNVEDVLDAYPDLIENFPTVIFQDTNQRDIEFADNNPLASNCEMTIHIFTKAIEGYSTTSEIAGIIYELMKENYFICSSNSEIPAEGDDVRHRVMVFRNNLF